VTSAIAGGREDGQSGEHRDGRERRLPDRSAPAPRRKRVDAVDDSADDEEYSERDRYREPGDGRGGHREDPD